MPATNDVDECPSGIGEFESYLRMAADEKLRRCFGPTRASAGHLFYGTDAPVVDGLDLDGVQVFVGQGVSGIASGDAVVVRRHKPPHLTRFS
jgi:hypothetical protein